MDETPVPLVLYHTPFSPVLLSNNRDDKKVPLRTHGGGGREIMNTTPTPTWVQCHVHPRPPPIAPLGHCRRSTTVGLDSPRPSSLGLWRPSHRVVSTPHTSPKSHLSLELPSPRSPDSFLRTQPSVSPSSPWKTTRHTPVRQDRRNNPFRRPSPISPFVPLSLTDLESFLKKHSFIFRRVSPGHRRSKPQQSWFRFQ